MKRLFLLSLLLVAACSDPAAPDPVTMRPVDPPMAAQVPNREETLPQPIPPKQVPTIRLRITEACLAKPSCRSKIAGGGLAVQRYFQNGVTMRPYTEVTGAAIYATGYGVSCVAPDTSGQCLVRYLGASIFTLFIPEACATLIACGVAIASAGYAWNDYFTYDDGYQGTGYNYGYPLWNPMNEYPEKQ